eukprot:4008809-Prymnesium_polylepis.1
MLWDATHKLDAIDPEMTAINELLDNGFPQLLGRVTNGSLGYPTNEVVQLFALAKLITTVGSIALRTPLLLMCMPSLCSRAGAKLDASMPPHFQTHDGKTVVTTGRNC